ncbi:MAG: helix-hairpin-helix domain-containing protein [Planctomycetes bacterium]|nr:helix-hairpin-helix domain-containing protein [Planctomycetota bacterium]
MTSSGERSPQEGAPGRDRRWIPPGLRAEEWALLALAVLLVVVPAWLERCSRQPPDREEMLIQPLRIDVETAPWFEWTLLEGVGEARARQIVEFIRSRSPLESIDELSEIPGMPSGWLDKARPYLYLSPSRSAAGGEGEGGHP